MNINAVNEVLTQQTIDNIAFDVEDIKNNLPFLVNLSAKQRREGFNLSSKRFNFVSMVLVSLKVEPLILPSWVDANAFENDFTLYKQLFGIENQLQAILTNITETRMQVGAEAMKSANDIYNHVHKAKDRIPGVNAIYDELKKAFPGRGKNKIQKKDNNVLNQ